MQIRHADDADLGAILSIYNHVIATSTAVYTEAPATLADRKAWFDNRRALGYPVLVACLGGEVAGFSSFGDFRAAAGYRHTVEHTVHVRADQRGKGVGRDLILALFPLADGLGKHVMVGGVDGANDASIRFHERLGFERVAHFREIGTKFGRWLDLIFFQRFIKGEI